MGLKKQKLTQGRLKELLDYNPETGVFIWKHRVMSQGRISKKGGLIAGSTTSHGYLSTGIDCRMYYNHRLAWLWYNGYFPENHIDHIDRNKKNNSIKNLRESSQSCNMRNAGIFKNNTTGVKGVYYNKKLNKWEARISARGKSRYIAVDFDFMEAVCYRLAAEQCLDWEGCDSSSQAYQYIKKHCKRI